MSLQMGARSVAGQSGGLLLAAGYNSLIEKIFVPAIREADELQAFFPVVVSVDDSGRPCEFPDKTKLPVGAVVVFHDRAVFGWLSGTFKLKYGQRVLPLSQVKSARVFSAKPSGTTLWGVDIEENTKWSALFAERLDNALAESWARALSGQLTLDTSARTRSCITDACEAEGIPTSRPVCGACGVATVEMPTTAAASREKDASPTASPHPPRFHFGVTPRSVTRSGQLGLEVASITDGSPAQEAGLRAGDLIVAVGNRPVASSAAFERLLPTVATNGAVAIEWLRDGRTHHAEVRCRPPLSRTPVTAVAAAPEPAASPVRHVRIVGSIPAARLGLTPRPVTRSGQLGLEVASVTAGSPAQEAGLRAGDLIVAVGSRPVASSAAFDRLLPTVATGGAVTVEWLRDGRTHQAKVLLT